MQMTYIILGAIIFTLLILILNIKKSKNETKTIKNKIKGLPLKNNGFQPQELNNIKTNNEGIISSQKTKQSLPTKPTGWVVAQAEESLEIETVRNDTNYEVLVVDDSQTVLQYLKNILEKANYNVILKKDGEEAINYLRDNNNSVPNIILTDLEMPKLNGVELIKLIKDTKRLLKTPIIIVASNPEDQIYMLENKTVNGIIKKPFNKEDLIQQVNYLVKF